jgi:hypothetical protein
MTTSHFYLDKSVYERSDSWVTPMKRRDQGGKPFSGRRLRLSLSGFDAPFQFNYKAGLFECHPLRRG